VLDFLVVMVSYVGLLTPQNLTGLRTIRALRPLRAITRIRGMRVGWRGLGGMRGGKERVAGGVQVQTWGRYGRPVNTERRVRVAGDCWGRAAEGAAEGES
jgi:hypothetical protein